MVDPSRETVPELPREVAWIVCAAIAGFALAGTAERFGESTARAVGGAAVALVAGVLLVRASGWQVLPSAVLLSLGIGIIGSGTGSNVAWFAVCMVAGWCVLCGRRLDGLIFWAAALLLFLVEWTFSTRDPGWAAWSAGTTFSLLGSLLVRHEIRLMAELRSAQADLLQSARVDERNRIARELHDVIAHSLTVSLLHVTSARVALAHAPGEADAALAEAERIGMDALAEVRSTVGLLRVDGVADQRRAQPGAGDLEDLVAGFRAAGATVALAFTGDTRLMSPVAGLTVYRIGQEALTNAVKHAPGASIDVGLDVAADRIVLVVASAGPPTAGHGLGIVGMRERAAAIGGSLDAGPGAGGWLVTATIPVTP